ncbi:MAG TPA: contact-dependent growth inhibition system immunity protein [Pseudonocardiaceae bacterium]|nr:contact-dependent growth inhibition system immunity protein [Pseudonocardiaceae bacterium]
MADIEISLQGLEGDSWGVPPAPATELATLVFSSRLKPVKSLTPVELRVLIAQQIGVEILVPVALDLLQQYPFVCGSLYPGDLLATVLRLDPSFWAERPELRVRTSGLLDSLSEYPENLRSLAGPLINAARDFDA